MGPAENDYLQGAKGNAMQELPPAFKQFAADHPAVHQAYEGLAKAAHESGPLDPRTRHLVKLAISVGAGMEGAVRSHVGQAKDAGVTEAEIDHVILLSLTTIGLPSMVAARTWMRRALSEKSEG